MGLRASGSTPALTTCFTHISLVADFVAKFQQIEIMVSPL